MKNNYPYILEFECIAPTCDMESIGEKFHLTDDGEYRSDNKMRTREYKLLFLLDHTDHYRISKILMDGNKYVIPLDREKNWFTKTHPDLMKYSKIKG